MSIGGNRMIKNFGQRMLILNLLIVLFLIIVGNHAIADPVIGDISVSPTNPAPKSDVTFTVEISGNGISSVRLVVSECNKEKGVCHAPPQNVSMINIAGNTYEAEVTLKHDDVTSITYNVEIESYGKWIEYDDSTTTLKVKNDNSESNGNKSNDTPGFESLTFLVAITFIVMIIKRMKLKQ
jgi:hypothetical protein